MRVDRGDGRGGDEEAVHYARCASRGLRRGGKRPRWARWHRCARSHVLVFFDEDDPIPWRLLFVVATAYPVIRAAIGMLWPGVGKNGNNEF